MSRTFFDRLCAAVLAPQPIATDAQRDLIRRAIADTLGCAAAGFVEPVVRNGLAAYSGDRSETWSGARVESAEAALLVNAIAAHALDFDDVYLESMAHISTVLTPVVLGPVPAAPDEILSAFSAGLIAAKAVARRVGRGHYDKGWHGTGTIGAFGAAAAAGRLMRLTPDAMGNAFALAASQSGGIRVNFSTQAKPAHAGFAATAGFRAARLAAAGVTGSPAVFAERGYPGLYGTGDGEVDPGEDAFELRPDLISVKLYPCCYATHRMVGLALDARAAMGAAARSADYRLEVPQGGLEALVPGVPATGLAAKFSAAWCVAVTLLDGPPGMQHFTDAAVQRSDVRDVMARVDVVEDPAQPLGADIEYGEMRLTVPPSEGSVGVFTRTAIPGSPADPPRPEALRAKIASCLAVFEAVEGRRFAMPPGSEGLGLSDWLPTGAGTDQ